MTTVTIIMNNNHNNYDVNDDNISNQKQNFSYIVIEMMVIGCKLFLCLFVCFVLSNET